MRRRAFVAAWLLWAACTVDGTPGAIPGDLSACEEGCGAGKVCVNGRCRAACDASNCSGCCLQGVCELGDAAEACGRGGAACAKCEAPRVCRADRTCGPQ